MRLGLRGSGRVVAGIFVATVAFDGIGRLDSALGGQPRILLPVACLQSLLVLRECLVALAVQVQHAAQVNVRPGNQSRILAGGQRLLEIVDGLIGMAGKDGGPGQDEIGAGAIGDGFHRIGSIRRIRVHGKGLASHGAGRGHITRGKPRLGQVKTGQFMRLAAREHFAVAFLVKIKIASAMHLLVHVHAVDHLADGVFQAGGILFKLDHLLIKILSQHEALRHVVADSSPLDGIHLLLVNLALMLVARQR